MFGHLRLADRKLNFGVVAFNHDGEFAVDRRLVLVAAEYDVVRPDAQ